MSDQPQTATMSLTETWLTFREMPGWVNLLTSAGVPSDEIALMEDIEEVFLQSCFEYEKEHREEVKQKMKEFIAELPGEERKEARREYLAVMVGNINTLIAELNKEYKKIYQEGGEYLDRALIGAIILDCEKERKKKNAELKILSGNQKTGLTDSQINYAKERRFEDFLQLRRGKTICPFHPDKDPSFSVKNNRGHCYGCGWDGDIIDFVMAKNNFNFQQAVKYLG